MHTKGDAEIKFNRSKSLRIASKPQNLIPPRCSCSYPLIRLSRVDTDLKVPRISYNEPQYSPLISPTYSQILRNRDSKNCTITKEFKTDKQTLKKEFYSPKHQKEKMIFQTLFRA